MTEMSDHAVYRDPDTVDTEEMIAAKVGQDADSFSRAALLEHVVMVHKLAKPMAGKGKLIVASFGQDSHTGTDLPAKIEHFRIGDVNSMDAAIRRLGQEPHRNVYVSLAVLRPDLPKGTKGFEKDVVSVLGLVGDFDDANAVNYAARLPVTAPYVLETSPGRFQTFLPFDQPASVAEVKDVAKALKEAVGCDHGTADLSHVWRVPGTLNWPNKKKVDGGRSPEPQMALVVEPWDGSTISLDELRKVIPALTKPTNGSGNGNGARFDFNEHAAGTRDLPDHLLERMKFAPPEGQRSEHAFGFLCALVEMGWGEDDIFDEARKYASGFGERYMGNDKLLRADIARAQAKAKGDRRERSGRQHQDHQRQDRSTSYSETSSEEWPDPLPLVPPTEEPQPYPVDALPPILRDACVSYQAFGQQPMALIACSGLAAVSLATQGLADIERAPDLSGPIGLSVLVVAQSGERKTSADKRMSKAIRMWESDKTDEMKPDVDAARARMAAFEAERDGLLAKIKAAAGRPDGKSSKAKVEVADLDKLKHDLEVMETQAPVAPVVPSLFYEDVTPEKMAEDLALGWPSASLWSDEAGLVVGGHGMGRDSIMRYLALINRFWDGQSFSRKRSTTKSFTVKGRRLTTCLMMQESVLRQLLAAGDGVSRGSGFMARFLMTWPVSTMGGRFYRPGDPDDLALAAYDARLRALLDMPLPVDGDGMVLVPPVLPLSDDARETWIEFHDDVERELAHHGEFFDVKDFAAKTADNAARIAGVFHVLEHGPVGEVAVETMKQAAGLALWHLHEAKRIIGAIDVPEVLADAKALLEWLLSQDGDVAPKAVLHRGPSRLRDRGRRDEAIELLAETNHLVRKRVGRTQEVLELNPKLRGRP